jgi:hypothetical protein
VVLGSGSEILSAARLGRVAVGAETSSEYASGDTLWSSFSCMVSVTRDPIERHATVSISSRSQ